MTNLNSSKQSLFSFIWKFVCLQPWIFVSIFILTLTWTLDLTAWPYLLRYIVDTFIEYDVNREASWPILRWFLFYGFCLFVFVEVFCRLRDYLRAKAMPKLEAEIRMAMFDHIQHHSPRYFNEHFAGSLSNKISDMTAQVTQIIQFVLLIFPVFATCVASIVLFFQINALFAWLLAGWMVVHFGLCIVFSPKCGKLSNIHGEARSTLVGKIVDSLTNNFAVNLFFRFRFEKDRILRYQKIEQRTNFVSQRYTVFMVAVLGVTYLIGQVAINGFLVAYWLKNRVTTGEVVQIFNTVWNVTYTMWLCSEFIPQFFQSVGVAKQALSLMNDPQDVVDLPDAKLLSVKQGEIIFDNVSFHYGEKKLFHNKNVRIKGGEKVGLVGYSGAGKSTFVNLILRFYPLEKGRILIDGQDVAKITLESLHNQVALIPQDPLLFHRTLEENIHYGRTTASKEEIIKVAKLAHCHEFIKKCPNGYSSLVGERGTKLSGGERQRIAIARAMIADAPILILDEATSSLDSVTEKYIQESLEKLMQNRTTIVVAHRLSTLAKMDRILVFDQGKIVEEGSHTELIAIGGHYAKMWHSQAGGFLPEQPEKKEK